jgi:hypothetical protein
MTSESFFSSSEDFQFGTEFKSDIPVEDKESRFRLYTTEELAKIPEPDWLVENILPEKGLACLYGPPGCGKSFLALDLSLSIGCGIKWCDRKIKQGIAVYLLGEGSFGLSNRIAAWKSQFTSDPEIISHGFHACLSVVQFKRERETEFLAALKAFCEKPRLIVIDTIARSLVGGDENSALDMGLVVEGCDGIRKATGACILLVHHSGKDPEKGMRGSTALLGAVDTSILVSKQGELVEVTCQKQKDAERFGTLFFELKKVSLSGVSSSCFLLPKPFGSTDGPTRVVLAALRDVCCHGGGATSNEWLNAAEISERTFYRYRCIVVERGYVRNVGTEKRPRYELTEAGYCQLPSTAT